MDGRKGEEKKNRRNEGCKDRQKKGQLNRRTGGTEGWK